MIRFFNKFQIDDRLKLHTALSQVYGIGRRKALRMQTFYGLKLSQKAKLAKPRDDDEQNFEFNPGSEWMVDMELRLPLLNWLEREKKTDSYKARRKRQSLPCNGQRTHTNAQTPKKLRKLGKDVPMVREEPTHIVKAREALRKRREAAAKRLQAKKNMQKKGKGKKGGKGTKGKKKK